MPFSNKTVLPRFPIIKYGSNRIFGSNSFFTKGINKINLELNKFIPNKKYEFDEELRNSLKSYFLPFNKDLETITNLDTSVWQK